MLLPWDSTPPRVPQEMRRDSRVVGTARDHRHGGGAEGAREPLGSDATRQPGQEGLELIAEAGPGRRRGTAAGRDGIDAGRGARTCARRGGASAAGDRVGRMLPEEDHGALIARAEVYLSASRIEEYGVAQLGGARGRRAARHDPIARPLRGARARPPAGAGDRGADRSPQALSGALRRGAGVTGGRAYLLGSAPGSWWRPTLARSCARAWSATCCPGLHCPG